MNYYYENGLVVFTEEYHLARGYCCGNKCRHCPYNPKHERQIPRSDANTGRRPESGEDANQGPV